MKTAPRVAFFPDSFFEINGVARTCRQLETFARDQNFPFLTLLGGKEVSESKSGSVHRLQLQRSPLAFPVETDLTFDLWLWRYKDLVKQRVQAFKADVVHITGPSDLGQLGAYVAHSLHLPLVASWHTNLHEYAATRTTRLLSALPTSITQAIGRQVEKNALWATMRFYRLAHVNLAPNEELVHLVKSWTHKPTFLMRRGIDTTVFSPEKRNRTDQIFRIGYVGRLSTEKNVRFLADIEQGFIQAGITNYEFVIVGDGRERGWLQNHLRKATLPGVLTGEALSQAYANFDLFVFPSKTDTFGNVILEAQASGVPVLVTDHGGPKFLVQPGITGFLAHSDQEFVETVVFLALHPEWVDAMRKSAREQAEQASWNSVFGEVYQAYEVAITERTSSIPKNQKSHLRNRDHQPKENQFGPVV
jgi:glycosyltransferase involved in cell wall biosynthesis